MAPRAFWKGYLKLSLVTCRVAMAPAVSAREKIRFHTLNRRTGNRVVARYVDAVSGKPVEDDDQVKGYERGEDEYVMLEDDELDAVALDSSRTIDIERFVPRRSIGWVWYDAPHYLTPDDKVGEEAFAVIQAAMAETDTVGIARLVLYRRERAVMLAPRGLGIVLWTLRYGDELRDPDAYFAGIPEEKPAPKLVDLVGKLIDKRVAAWKPSLVEDPVQANLQKLIAAKKKGRKPAKPKESAAPPANVVNIMDSLRRSVEADRKRR
jgi:DNA end-binding protein Ku